MEIVIANKNDEKRIRELTKEMFQYVYGNDVVEYENNYYEHFFLGIDKIFLAKEDSIIGFISVEIHHDEIDYIYIDDFIVTKDYRGKGIGFSLISEVFSYASEIKINRIYLHVEKTNTFAFHFYEKLGFNVFKDESTRYLLEKVLVF